MTNFMVGFVYYGYMRNDAVSLFRQSQEALCIPTGASNSLIMLFSSWLMVRALNSVRSGKYKLASPFVLGAIACGIACTTLTGLHFTHLVVGTGLLACYVYILRFKTITPFGIKGATFKPGNTPSLKHH
ncbi:hypothetical protein [Zhongshania sp. BJYM1]|uniref:hypothetical protein n=1 Tax=Zhongshania aquatica TaxID=2965069 RepID=UPI0022B5AFA8|nr:hypothetical protein [Marortus sp. BJYM1]